jgi:fumarylacetoacetate (FAA) hydrolase
MLESGAEPTERFHERDALSPLPRAYQWADGSAYVNHVELVRKARGAEMPASFWEEPLMYQGGSDSFLAPRGPIKMADEAWGIDCEGEVAVIVGDVPMGADIDTCREAIELVMLVNDVSLRGLIPAELAKGFGFFQAKPSSAFSPVTVTPDELGDAWDGGKLSLPLDVDLNGEAFGRANAGVDMTFDFAQLIAHAAKTRPLVRRNDHRFRYRVEQGARRRSRQAGERRRCGVLVHCRDPHDRNHRIGQAGDALHAVRRHRAHRDEGRGWPFDIRRHRANS